MNATMLDVNSALPQPEFARHGSPQAWAVVLAGGDGVRLRPLVRRLFGDERPKQYVPLLGPASLLRQTLDRVARLVPPERTVVVSRVDHAAHLARELAQGPPTRVLLQPLDRGTGTAVLFAAHWIRQWDPALEHLCLRAHPSDALRSRQRSASGRRRSPQSIGRVRQDQ